MRLDIKAYEDIRVYSKDELLVVVSNILQNTVPDIGFNYRFGEIEEIKDSLIYVKDVRDNEYSIVIDVDRDTAKKLLSPVRDKHFKDKAYEDRYTFVSLKHGFGKLVNTDTRIKRQKD